MDTAKRVAPSKPFVFIALQHMWRLKFCNPKHWTNVIGGATRLAVSIDHETTPITRNKPFAFRFNFRQKY